MNPYEEARRLDAGDYDHQSPRELYERFRAIAMEPRAMGIDVITLERKVFARRQEIENRTLHQMKRYGEFHTWEDKARDRMVLEMRAFVYGKDHPVRHIIRFPSDWLEALKERFAPAWIRDRWPVRFTEVTASLEELYPGIEQSIPDRPAVMKIQVIRRDQFPVW